MSRKKSIARRMDMTATSFSSIDSDDYESLGVTQE